MNNILFKCYETGDTFVKKYKSSLKELINDNTVLIKGNNKYYPISIVDTHIEIKLGLGKLGLHNTQVERKDEA